MANRLVKYELGGGAGVADGGDYSKVIIGDTFPVTSSTGMLGVCTDFSGNVYVSDETESAIYKVTESGFIRIYAGGIYGYANGALGVGRLHNPNNMACDKSGNIYVADTGNNRIRKIDTNGNLFTIAGGFNAPQGVAVMPNGDLIVADTSNHKIWKLLQDGNYYPIAGAAEGDVAGSIAGVPVKGSTAKFSYPTSVAVDASGNIYVADSRNYKIKKIDSSGWVTTFAGSTRGSANAQNPLAAQFYKPVVVQTDKTGNVYVLDMVNNKGRIKVINGKVGVATVAYTDTANSTRGFAVSPACKLFAVLSTGAAASSGGILEHSSQSSLSSASSGGSSLSSQSSLSSVDSSQSSQSSANSQSSQSGHSSLSSQSSSSSSLSLP